MTYAPFHVPSSCSHDAVDLASAVQIGLRHCSAEEIAQVLRIPREPLPGDAEEYGLPAHIRHEPVVEEFLGHCAAGDTMPMVAVLGFDYWCLLRAVQLARWS